MIRRQEGFSLVELMITMVIFVMVIVAVSNIFSELLNQFKQQSKIAETNIEGIVGLEMLRTDVQQAGYGMPWNVEMTGNDSGDDDWNLLGANYTEAFSNGGGNANRLDPIYYNDGSPASALPAPTQRREPRPILAENHAGPLMGTATTWRSDYLVVKATSLATSAAGQAWTYVTNDDTTNTNITSTWNTQGEDLIGTDRVIVLRPAMGAASAQLRVLITDNGATPAIFTTFAEASNNNQDVFEPALGTSQTHLIYGVDPTTNLRMPFNRADYYVSRPAGAPSRCAPNTGVLYKAILAQGGTSAANQFGVPLPLLDCVADMQVVFISDTTPPGGTPVWNDADWTNGLTAQNIRDQLLEVRIYVLAHEGQRDPSFTFTSFSTGCAGVANCMRVGDIAPPPVSALRGREFDLSWVDPGFANYRWKIYTMSVKLPNLK